MNPELMMRSLEQAGFTADQVSQMLANPEVMRQMMLAKGIAPQVVDQMVQAMAQIGPDAVGSAVGTAVGTAGMFAFLAGMGIFLLVMIAVSVVVVGIPLFKLAKRFSVPHAWMAWVPILQIFTIVQVAGKPWWWGFFIFLGIIPVIGAFAALAISVYLFMEISKRTGHAMWVGVLSLIPVVNILLLYYFAYAKPGSIFPAAETQNSAPPTPTA